MFDGKYIAEYLLKSKSQRPFAGILRNLLYSIVFTLMVLLISVIFSIEITLEYFYAVIFISCFIFYFGWGAERLWYAFVSNNFYNPFSLTAYITRIPLWFISGGIALSFSSLIVFKLELIDLITWTRQYVLFLYGGILNLFVQLPLQYYTYHSIKSKINKHNITSNYENNK